MICLAKSLSSVIVNDISSMTTSFNSHYPSIEDLRRKAKSRVPKFAFEYLEGGCNSEINLKRNTAEIREVRLKPQYIGDYDGADLSVELFGIKYDAPFGIAPIGLQGLMWPKACELLAAAAYRENIPFCLSTVSTASIENIADITHGRAWFQLYHPAEEDLRDKLVTRAAEAGFPVLVLLADTPTFGYRPKEIKNGLSIPPRMSLSNVIQMCQKPSWCAHQLLAGKPEFASLKPYIPKGLNMKHLGLFMNKTFQGRLTEDRIKALRDLWKGKLVVKGIVTEEDAEKVLSIGVDGIISSNHGGRQLDAGQSTIRPMAKLAEKFGDKMTVMLDSGIRNGSDIACVLASGAKFTFLGRSFMYGVSALGEQGGTQTITILKRQLQQVMEQVACKTVKDFPDHLLKE